LSYGFSVLGKNFFIFFLFILAVPSVFILFYVSSSVVKSIYQTQPWYHGNLKKWQDFEPEEKKLKQEEIRNSKLKGSNMKNSQIRPSSGE
jgi:hypothetical protein